MLIVKQSNKETLLYMQSWLRYQRCYVLLDEDLPVSWAGLHEQSAGLGRHGRHQRSHDLRLHGPH